LIFSGRYGRRERRFGISPGSYQPVTLALATDRKVTGFFCSDRPVQKPVKLNRIENLPPSQQKALFKTIDNFLKGAEKE
jgi:hypothetical protein